MDELDSSLDAFCLSRGTSLVFLDKQIADDNVNKTELLRLREKLRVAHRRKDIEAMDGWLHALMDELDCSLDAYCFVHGYTSIAFMDEQVAALPDDNVNKAELLRLRAKAKDAHRRKDLEALDGWLHALMIGVKSAAHTIPLAVTGEKFRKGRKPNTGGPIRKAIARELEKNPNLKPKDVWEALAKKPPKGWTFFDNDLGKYIERPKGPTTGYSRFSAICKEEKDKLTT